MESRNNRELFDVQYPSGIVDLKSTKSFVVVALKTVIYAYNFDSDSGLSKPIRMFDTQIETAG